MLGDDLPSFSPFAARMRRQNSARSLSAIMQGLRQEEEERLDEELDLLNEMEDDDGPANGLGPKKVSAPKILVQDSQAGGMSLGSDMYAEGLDALVSEEDEPTTNHEPSARKWKKRGQKRTTRHVKMRPNTAKWQPEAAWKGDNDEDDLEEGGVDGAATNSRSTDSTSKSGTETQGKTSTLSKAKRKISATAHANFRALKIRNKNSKFKKGGGRRYR